MVIGAAFLLFLEPISRLELEKLRSSFPSNDSAMLPPTSYPLAVAITQRRQKALSVLDLKIARHELLREQLK
jgi:hypothetical protein